MNEILERYYTEDSISALMMSMIPCKSPNLVLDLGVGEASLTKAAFLKWKDATFIGVDIDVVRIERNRELFPFCKFLKIDALSPNFIENTGLGIGNVDIAICNPPYSKSSMMKNLELEFLLEQSGLTSINKKNINTEILFLLYNLSMLKNGGHLGIILPDGIFTNHNYNSLRKELLQRNTISHIIELPEKVFYRTEAKTHILLLKKGIEGKTKNNKVTLLRLDSDGNIGKPILLKESKLENRMDYKFHNTCSNRRGETLQVLDAIVFRGSFSHCYLRENNISHFHTTDFKKFNDGNIILDTELVQSFDEKVARKGDILVARVGKRVVGKWGIVKKGKINISDCIFVIRLPKEHRKRMLKYLKSDIYLSDVESSKHGVCSQVLSKTDIINFKIPF